jgi:hypothetical protein
MFHLTRAEHVAVQVTAPHMPQPTTTATADFAVTVSTRGDRDAVRQGSSYHLPLVRN